MLNLETRTFQTIKEIEEFKLWSVPSCSFFATFPACKNQWHPLATKTLQVFHSGELDYIYIYIHSGGDQTMQIYGNFEGFAFI